MAATHKLYIAQQIKLAGTVVASLANFAYSESRSFVSPRGDATLRTQKSYTVAVEETLTVEFENVAIVLPTGAIAFEATGVALLEADTFGTTLILRTKAAVTGPPAVAAGTVQVMSQSRTIGQDGQPKLSVQFRVNSTNGLDSGLEWV